MKKILTIFCLLIAHTASADVPAEQATEVDYLLNFVRQSQCTIDRNGTHHTGPKASEHIKKKYDYFRDDIKTTEDFIKYAATKSTLSGKYYSVICPNRDTIKTQAWLLNELSHFRKKSPAELIKKQSTICTNPRPQMCTMEYLPVCATLSNKTTKTYASGCSACADKNVISYKSDAC